MSQILSTLAELISSSRPLNLKSPKASKIKSVELSPVDNAMASFDLSRELLDSACLDQHKYLDERADRSKSLDYELSNRSGAKSKQHKDCDLSSLNESIIKLDPLLMSLSH